jgi:hypothetical protein
MAIVTIIAAASSSVPAEISLRPSLLASRTATPEVTARPTGQAMKVRPTLSAEKPWPACSWTVSTRKIAAMVEKAITVTSSPAANDRSPNSDTGTSADPARSRRAWYLAKAASTGREAAIIRNAQAGQPSSAPWMSGYSSSSKPTDTSATPSRSSCGRRCERDSRTHAAAAGSAIRPTGTLIQNTDRQPRPNTSLPTSRPPMMGAAAAPSPLIAP